MSLETSDPGALEAGFSSTKKHILLHLKRQGGASLADLSRELGISKMATLKHMTALEAKGLVEREFRAGGRGRPRAHFRLRPGASRLFPEAYANVTAAALEFIEDRLGREAVVELLERRSQKMYERYRPEMEDKPFRDRVRALARIRDEGGYMAEVGSSRGGTFELLEHNCPIAALAGEYGEACDVERRLFQKLLRADVDTTHRVVAGAPVCRFMIRTRAAERRKSA